jgi:hypothetical protein
MNVTPLQLPLVSSCATCRRSRASEAETREAKMSGERTFILKDGYKTKKNMNFSEAKRESLSKEHMKWIVRQSF